MATRQPIDQRRITTPTPPARKPGNKGAAPAGRSPAAKTPAPTPPRRAWLTFFIVLAVNYFLVRLLFPSPDAAVTVPYTLFKQEVTRHNVQAIYSRGASITGRFRAPVTWPRDSAHMDSASRAAAAAARPRQGFSLFGRSARATPRPVTDFATELPAFADPGLETLLTTNGVEISAEPIQEGNTWLNLFMSFAPTLLIIALYVWFFRRAAKMGAGGGAGSGLQTWRTSVGGFAGTCVIRTSNASWSRMRSSK